MAEREIDVSQPIEDHTGEDWARVPVPRNARQGLFSLTTLNAGYNISPFTIVFGGIIGASFNLWDTFTSALTGTAILMVFSALLAYIGMRTGRGIALLARQTFGDQGTMIPTFLWGVAFLVWNATIGVSMVFLTPAPWAIGSTAGWPLLVLGILSFLYLVAWGIAAVFGIRIMKWVSNIGIPLILALMVVGTIMAIVQGGGLGELGGKAPANPGIPWIFGAALAITSWLIGATTVPDIARFAKNGVHSTTMAVIGMGVMGVFQFLMGAIMVLATGSTDLGVAFTRIFGGFGWVIPIVWLIIFIGSWTTTQMEVYAGSVTFANVFKRSRVTVAIAFTFVSALIGGLMVPLGLNDSITTWMLILGQVYPGFLGAMIADWLIIYRFKEVRVDPIRWKSLITWIVTAAISVYLYQTGNIGLAIVYYTPIIGIVIQLLLHIPEMQGAQRRVDEARKTV